MLENSKNVTYANSEVTILSSLSEENIKQLDLLADELCGEVTDAEIEEKEASNKKKFVCKLCGYVHEADELEDDFTCPLCKRPVSEFEEMK